MSIVETTLIFVGIPLAVFLLAAALVYGGAAARTPRYRPGGAWQFQPVWYLPHPEQVRPAPSTPPVAMLDGAAGRTLPSGASRALPGQLQETVTASGGASGEW
jgi:hypothetical protein